MSATKLKILDVASATGLGGVALCRSLLLTKNGMRLTLHVNDIRSSELALVEEWMRDAGISSSAVNHHAVIGDAKELHQLIENERQSIDIALFWGFSAVHFDPWQLSQLYASVATLLTDDGVFIVEEIDRLSGFFESGYKDFLVEGQLNDETQVISLSNGFDILRGMYKRTFYLLPGFRRVGDFEFRPWDLSAVAAMGYLFFSEVDMVFRKKHGISGAAPIILFKSPRRRLLPEDIAGGLEQVKQKD